MKNHNNLLNKILNARALNVNNVPTNDFYVNQENSDEESLLEINSLELYIEESDFYNSKIIDKKTFIIEKNKQTYQIEVLN